MSRRSNPIKVQQWSARFKRFGSSGQSVTQFCRAEGVSQPSFYQWKKKLGVSAAVRTGAVKSDSSAFKPVQLTTPTPDLQSATIRLPGGIEIELGNDPRVIEAVVKQLLQVQAMRAGDLSCSI
jgi:hypothetical protein